jgi:hypothetical protein
MKKKLIAVFFGVLLAAATASAQIVVRIGPPPAPRHEVVPAAPGPGYEWIAGYHRYDGHGYVWVPGHYEHAPRPHAHWVAGHWAHRNGGYVWIEGHWRG